MLGGEIQLTKPKTFELMKTKLLSVLISLTVVAASSMHAAVTSAAKSGPWGEVDTWGGALPPAANQAGVGNDYTVTLNEAGATYTYSALYLGYGTSGSGGTVDVTAGTLSFTAGGAPLSIGYTASKTGTLNVNGGNITTGTGTVNLGSAANSIGVINLTSGNITIGGSNGAINLGNNTNNSGTLDIKGGSFVAKKTFHVGNNSSSTGTIKISGGVLDAGTAVINVGMVGTGTFDVSGGSVTAGTLNIGSKGTLKLDSSINLNGVGAIAINGGVLEINFDSTLGNDGSFDFYTAITTGEFDKVLIVGAYAAELTLDSGIWSQTITTGGTDATFDFTTSTGVLNVSVAPIPEPSTYAAVLGALTLLALAIRRRNA